MTVSSTTNVVTYTGNGVTTQFPYDFLIPTEDDLEVTILTIATGALSDPLDPVDFSVSGIGDENGGEVTYVGLTADYKINIRRKLDLAQELDIPAQGTFFPNLLEGQLDRIVMMIQQVNEELGRAVKVTLGDTISAEALITALLDAAAAAATSAANASSASSAAALAQAAAEAAQLAAELAASTTVADAEALLQGYVDAAAASAQEAADAAAQSGTGGFVTYTWTATAGQSVFNGADATPPLTTEPANRASCFITLGRLALDDADVTLAGVNFTLVGDTADLGEKFQVKVATTDIINVVSDDTISTVKIQNDAVTNAKLANMAEATIKGRAVGAGTGDPTDLTAAQVRAITLPANAAGNLQNDGAGNLSWAAAAATVDSYDAVGSYCLASTGTSAATVSANSTLAGSSLVPSGILFYAPDPTTGGGGARSGSALSGTWRAHGYSPGGYANRHGTTLWIRTV